MNLLRLFTAFLVLLTIPLAYGQQKARIVGFVTDETGKALYPATITVQPSGKGTITNTQGRFEIDFEPGIKVILDISYLGYEPYTDTLQANPGQTIEKQIALSPIQKTIEDIYVIGNQERENTLTPIDIKSFDKLPTASGNLESLIKTLPGVTSGNELSAQYSVRGGSYDENLIYVNDIEIYRPLLVQTAKQEGLSFINPTLISSIQFSAGGFDARYGDKMSSVLDIQYRRPSAFEGSLNASLLGGGIHLGGSAFDGKVNVISGLRYKTTKYVLGSLDTQGEYVPSFFDWQSYLTYDLTKKTELGVLFNVSSNRFSLKPTERNTDFGTIQQSFNLRVAYEGQERDLFDTYMGALTLTHRFNDHTQVKLIASGFYSHEEVTYDIWSFYLLNELASSTGGTNDTLVNIGVGSSLEHARNYLDASVLSLEHKGSHFTDRTSWRWGVKWQSEHIVDELNEWQLIDSAGYSITDNPNELSMHYAARSNNTFLSNRFSGYLQNSIDFRGFQSKYRLTLGIRGQYWDFNDEWIFSPRGTLVAYPDWAPRLSFHASGGVYYQSPFYKEFRDYQGNIYRDVKSQRSIHYVLGMDFQFTAWDRPFSFTAEAYYKYMNNLIPFKIDDVRIIYLPNYTAQGYAEGIDLKVYGEFVEGLESWFSLSLLKTREDVYKDHYLTLQDEVVYPGYYRRPNDQLITFSIFFQDYFPTNPKFRLHLMLNYGTGLPYTGPDINRPSQNFPLDSYRRIDVGLSRMLIGKKKSKIGLHDAWLSFEVLNLLDAQNKVSYDWIRTVENNDGMPNVFAVPNYLTGRRFNLKLSTRL